MKYTPLPGTRGIRLAIKVEVTGVFKNLAIISEYIVIAIEEYKNEAGIELPLYLKNIYTAQPNAPPALAQNNFFPLRLNIIPKAKVLAAAHKISNNILYPPKSYKNK